MPRYPLCPDHDWCFYEAIDNYTIIIEIAYLFALIIFTIVLSKKFSTLIQLRKDSENKRLFGKGFMQVYYLIVAWLICTLVKVVINVFVYFLIMQPEDGMDPQAWQPIVILSSIFLLFEYGCGFFLMFLMLLIPYSWVKQLLLNTREISTISRQVRLKLNYSFNYLKVIQKYSKWVRPWFIVWLFIEPILLFFTDTGIACQSLAYNAYFIYFQSLLIFATYIFGYFVTRFMQKHELLVLSDQDKKKIIKQYVFLLAVMVLRICLNFIFKISGLYEYEPNSTCYDHDNRIASSVFLTLAQFLMHLFPVCVILYIYEPSVEERLREQKIMSFVQNRIRSNSGLKKKGTDNVAIEEVLLNNSDEMNIKNAEQQKQRNE